MEYREILTKKDEFSDIRGSFAQNGEIFMPSDPNYISIPEETGEEYEDQLQSEGLQGIEKESNTEKYEEFGILYGYFRDIAKESLLSAKEEIELSTRIKKFEARADEIRAILDRLIKSNKKHALKRVERLSAIREEYSRRAQGLKSRFISSNLRLVIKIARRYMGKGLPLSDLIQEGNAGLIKAVERFDPTKGFKFSTYAVWWIQQAIVRALLEQTKTIKIPVYLLEKASKVYGIKSALEKGFNRKPTAEEIAKEAEMSAEQVTEILRAKEDVAPLDVPVLKGEDATFLDFVPDLESPTAESLIVGETLTERLNEAFSILTPREEEVIKMRFGIDGDTTYTLEEIGQKYNLSRERIRQIEKEALNKIALSKTGEELRSFLE
ncbi:MAG TPA: sigma-70 family RNA polymerase sigma factor [Thermodesulfobacteriota bacterium]|nr:sigma-70 family RNA polymerase sigma factor [Thermodesulfobacteriota bacterium]